MKARITIEYCPKCNWLLRAAYMAQELLTTFGEELEEVALRPSDIAGRYSISVNEVMVFDRKREGGFLEIKRIKQLVRDVVAPEKELGHSDNHSKS